MDRVISKNNVPIRFPEERWLHITEEHSEIAGYYYDVLETVQKPDVILEGSHNELLALKTLTAKKYLIVVYKEVSKTDGFIITAFMTSKGEKYLRRKKIWPR